MNTFTFRPKEGASENTGLQLLAWDKVNLRQTALVTENTDTSGNASIALGQLQIAEIFSGDGGLDIGVGTTAYLNLGGGGLTLGQGFASSAASSVAGGLTLTTAGITMTGLDVGATAAEIGDVYSDGFLRFGESADDPSNVVDKGFVYTKDVAGKVELFYYSDQGAGGASVQLTSAGGINIGELTFSLDDAYNDGRTITVDEGPVVLDHSATSGILELQPGLAAETAAAIKIGFTAVAYTGTPHGIEVDYSSATSLTNAGSIYGVNLKGKTNAGDGSSIGLYIDGGWDVGALVADDTPVKLGSDSDWSLEYVSASTTLQMSGDGLDIDATGAVTLDTSDASGVMISVNNADGQVGLYAGAASEGTASIGATSFSASVGGGAVQLSLSSSPNQTIGLSGTNVGLSLQDLTASQTGSLMVHSSGLGLELAYTADPASDVATLKAGSLSFVQNSSTGTTLTIMSSGATDFVLTDGAAIMTVDNSGDGVVTWANHSHSFGVDVNMLDEIQLQFGTGADFKLAWDNTNSVLELFDGTNSRNFLSVATTALVYGNATDAPTHDFYGNVSLHNDLTVVGNIYQQGGTSFSVDATIEIGKDTVKVFGAGPGATHDGGIGVERYRSDWADATPTGTGTAQGPGSGLNTIQLAADEIQDPADGWIIFLTGGTGSGQQNRVKSWADATKTATCYFNWGVAPDATTTYALHSPADMGTNNAKAFPCLLWDESTDLWTFTLSDTDPSSGQVTLEDYAGLKALSGAFTTTLDVDGATTLDQVTIDTADAAFQVTGANNFDCDSAVVFSASIGIDTAVATIAHSGATSLKISSVGTSGLEVECQSGTLLLDATGQTLDMDCAALDIDASSSANLTAVGITLEAGTGAFSIEGDTASTINTTAANLTLSTTTSGTLALNAVAALDMDGVAVTLDASGGFSIDGAGAECNVSATSQNLTLSTISAGNLILSSAATLDADAVTIQIDASGAFSIDADTASNVSVTTGDLTLSTITSGTLYVTSAALLDIDAGANIDIDVTGTFDVLATGAFSVDGTGASNVTAASGNLTLSTTTSGNLVLTAAGEIVATSVLGNAGSNLAIGDALVPDADITHALGTSGSAEWSALYAPKVSTADSLILESTNADGLVYKGRNYANIATAGGTTITQWSVVYIGKGVYAGVSMANATANAGSDAQGRICGVATEAIAVDASGQVALDGVVTVRKADAETWTAGDKLYLSKTAGLVTKDTSGHTTSNDIIVQVGYADDDFSTGTTGRMLISVGPIVLVP